jgi:hypothetical protein
MLGAFRARTSNCVLYNDTAVGPANADPNPNRMLTGPYGT